MLEEMNKMNEENATLREEKKTLAAKLQQQQQQEQQGAPTAAQARQTATRLVYVVLLLPPSTFFHDSTVVWRIIVTVGHAHVYVFVSCDYFGIVIVPRLLCLFRCSVFCSGVSSAITSR